MNRYSTLRLVRRVNATTMAAVMLVAAMLPLLINSQANAAQVTNRSITMASSVANTETNYTVSFIVPDPGSAHLVGSFRVEFCDDNPLAGLDCDGGAGDVSAETGDTVPCVFTTDANANSCGSIATLSGSPTFGSTAQAISMTAPTTAGQNYLDFTLAAQEDVSGDSAGQRTFTVTINNIDNPDNSTDLEASETFYARMYAFSAITTTAYDKDAPPLGVDEGGVALSTADQLTVNARVQEELEFCVGAVTAANVTSITTTAGQGKCDGAAINADTEVNLGVISSGAISASPVAAANGGNAKTGAAIIRTNAVNGATVSYFAEPPATVSGGDTDQLGALRVNGVDCNATASNATDQCFYSSNAGLNLVGAGEGFGVQVGTISDTADTTTSTLGNLTAQGAYATGATTYAWDPTGGTQILASSTGAATKVLDYTHVPFTFGARTAATTPTGSYTVTSTYIATATY